MQTGNNSNAAQTSFNNDTIRFKSWGATTMARGGGGSHSHGDTGSTSSLPPYLVIYAWKRTA